MSQEKLAAAFELTFQQVQKYEKGTNRMGSSRLQQAAGILGVPVSYFFEGGADGPFKSPGGLSPSYVDDFISSWGRPSARKGVHEHPSICRSPSHRCARERNRGWGMKCPTSSRSAPSSTTGPRIA